MAKNKTEDNAPDLKQENEKLQSQLNKFEEMFVAMQKQIEVLQSTPASPQIQVEDKTDVEKSMVYIGSNIMGRETLSVNKDGSNGIKIYGHKKPIGVTFVRMSAILEVDKYRRLFEKGLFFFSDSKWYKTFSVDTKLILNDETISKLLIGTRQELITRLNEITDNKNDSSVVHCVLFRIAYLLKNNSVPEFDFQNMDTLKSYFGVDISDTMRMLEFKEQQE